jgi:hypothetical protein
VVRGLLALTRDRGPEVPFQHHLIRHRGITCRDCILPSHMLVVAPVRDADRVGLASRVADVGLRHHVVPHQPVRDSHVQLCSVQPPPADRRVPCIIMNGSPRLTSHCDARADVASHGRSSPTRSAHLVRHVAVVDKLVCAEAVPVEALLRLLGVRARHVVREVVQRAKLEVLVRLDDLLLLLPGGVGPAGVEGGLVRRGDRNAAAVTELALVARVA